jgi:nicotinamidase-related amidase
LRNRERILALDRDVLDPHDRTRLREFLVEDYIQHRSRLKETGAPVEVPVAREIVPNVNQISAAVRAHGGINISLRMTVDSADVRAQCALQIDTLIISGTLTNCCCESTARDAMQMNYKIIFVSAANAALENMAFLFGDPPSGAARPVAG